MIPPARSSQKPNAPIQAAPSLSAGTASWLSAGAALAALAVAAPSAQQALGLSGLYAYKVLGLFAAAGAIVAWLAGRHLGTRAFGAANHVTLARAAGVALAAGALGETPAPALAWLVVAVALAILLLDGVDGRLARAQGTAGPFGARFDMETDALLALVLALLVVQFDKAGAIVLAAGVSRYAFAAAGVIVPALKRPLPPSRRRQTLCVVQLAALGLCLVPWLGRPVSGALGIAAVVAVAASFAIDVRWLARSERAHHAAAAPR